MAVVIQLTFNAFSENTYLIYDHTGECLIVDPGCSNAKEEDRLFETIRQHQLKPVRLLNTHCHIDHVLGNTFVAETFQLELEAHANELPILRLTPQIAAMYGVPYPKPSPEPTHLLNPETAITFGQTTLEVLFTPGHSPGSVAFLCRESNFVVVGDVLFREGIGRTDLPGGNQAELFASIKNELFILDEATVVWPGHGPETTIGYEIRHNPFFN